LAPHQQEIHMIAGIGMDRAREAGRRFRAREEQRRAEENQPRAVTEDSSRLATRLRLKGYTKVESEALIALGKTGGAPAAVTLERIINENDLTAIEFFVVGLAVARAVCRIVIRDHANRVMGYGTGFRIGPRLIMTSNHVLETADVAAVSLAEFDYVRPFGERQLAVIPVALDPSRFFVTNPHLDFTVIALPAQDRALAGGTWLPLTRESGKAIKREAVNIIQHPSGEPLSIAFRNNLIVDVLEDFLHYGTDTMPGSSGSPVTNDAWHLAALHHSG